MMDKFRNLSHNIFFKIFLGFLGLTFVMFGVSGFILGGNNSWVAKVGNKTISYDQFLKVWQNDRDAISRANNSPEALKYLESAQFKQDVISRMITKTLIQSVQEEFKIYPDQNLILKEIASSPELKDKDGKFDRNLYQNFLKSNNLTEKQHISDLSDQIVGALILQSFAETPTVNQDLAQAIYQNRYETRTADLITISTKNIGEVKAPNEFELNAFFEKNKEKFALPEMRKVSVATFKIADLKQKITISDEEIAKEYQANKAEYQIPETRNFYHIALSDEKSAQEFAQALKSETADKAALFQKLAIAKGKDKSTLLLTKVSKADLPKEISQAAFALAKNQTSEVLKSPFGFHILYVADINPAAEIPLAEATNQIKSKLAAAKEQSQVENALKGIEDEILATNSIEKVAEKFHLSLNRNLPKFNFQGLDSKQSPIPALNSLDDLVKNSFSVENGKVSKIFASKSNQQYYIIAVDEVNQGRQRSIDEVKVLAADLWTIEAKQQKLKELAENISKDLNANNGNIAAIAKYGVKVEKNRQFPRFYMIDAGNGRKVPYANKLLTEIFTTPIGQATKANQTSANEMVIAVVRNLQTPANNEQAVKIIASDIQNSFRTDILTVFNQYITKQFPVEINQKLIQTSDKTDNGK